MIYLNRNNLRLRRDGISIIEVLTSMIVATIGVFGVMVLIPFAVKQSQTGLDNDAANALGRNAVEDMQTQRGFAASNILNRPDGATNYLFDGFERIVIQPAGETNPRHFNFEAIPAPWNLPVQEALHFDPIGVGAGLNTLAVGEGIVINSGTLTNVTDRDEIASPPRPISLAEAFRFCRSSDDLVYESGGDDVLETAPPQPVFDTSAGVATKRQSIGRISWSMFMVPEKSQFLTFAPQHRFKTYTLVYRDRFVDPVDVFGSSYSVHQTDMAGGGYSAQLNVLTFAAGNAVNTEEVVRGSWIMLVNRLPEPATAGIPVNGGFTAAEFGNRIQLGFARVTRVNAAGTVVSVDGSPFEFVTAGLTGASGGPASSQTYAIHLKNVVNVFERSIAVER